MSEKEAPIFLAQCKAYQSLEETARNIETLLDIQKEGKGRFYFSVPYSFAEPLSKQFSSQGITFGTEGMLNADEGNFTHSISAKMLERAGVKFTLLGAPDERRQANGSLSNKTKAALQAEITPFICIEETQQEFQDGKSKEILDSQLQEFSGFSPEEASRLYVVYNPSWINQAPWEAKSPDLQTAYKTFQGAIAASPLQSAQIIAAVPAYSWELPALIASFADAPFAGYSLGVISFDAERVVQMPLHQPQFEAKPDEPSAPGEIGGEKL